MDKIHEIAGGGALMPRFDDGMVNMAELIRVMAESLVNEIMDAQADEACEGGNQRNGYRERKLVTSVGTINLRIPKLRACSYFPEDLIERYSRVDRAVIAAVSEMVANGVSTRKVKRVAQAIGIGRMSASQVPRICSSLDESVADLQERDLSDVICPYIWLDATYTKCRIVPTASSSAAAASCRSSPSRRSLIRLMGAVFSEMDENWAGRRWFGDDSIGRAAEGAKVNEPAHAHEGTAAEHAARITALVVAANPIPGGRAA